MEALSKLGCAVPLAHLADRHPATPQVVVTFDDGYADNLLAAKPVVERFEIPAAFFVTTAYIGSVREFWWDELENLLLQPGSLPSTLYAKIDSRECQWDLNGEAEYPPELASAHAGWLFDQPPPTTRHKLFWMIYMALQPLAHDRRRSVLDDLWRQAGAPSASRCSHRPLSAMELVQLASGGLAEIGSHTATHRRLSQVSASDQLWEMATSQAALEELLGSPVRLFSYPFGSRADYSRETCKLANQSGFQLACSNCDGVVRGGFDHFQIPRMYVADWNGDEFRRRIGERLYG
jgi:peptidoglycan/xylan/chitin deacetylase (PgdA/CDA1 family)